LNGTVDNISRADALLKMRRMAGSETLVNFFLSSAASPSAAKEHVLGMLFGTLAQMGEGIEKSKFDFDSPPDKVKAELSDELCDEVFNELTATAATRVPLLLQSDLLEKAPSDVMCDPVSCRTNNLYPSASWDVLLMSYGEIPSELSGTRWNRVADELRSSSGVEDTPRCDESVWAGLIRAMGGEYASLDSLASVVSAQVDLYYSRCEDSQ